MTESTDPEFDELAAAAEAERKKAEERNATIKFWLIVAAVAVLCGILVFKPLTHHEDDDPAGDAPRACEQFVKDRLKAPSTATFSAESVSDDGDERYTVTGSVDAQNSFGAMLRDRYTCVIRNDGNTWHLVSLTGLT